MGILRKHAFGELKDGRTWQCSGSNSSSVFRSDPCFSVQGLYSVVGINRGQPHIRKTP